MSISTWWRFKIAMWAHSCYKQSDCKLFFFSFRFAYVLCCHCFKVETRSLHVCFQTCPCSFSFSFKSSLSLFFCFSFRSHILTRKWIKLKGKEKKCQTAWQNVYVAVEPFIFNRLNSKSTYIYWDWYELVATR